MLPNICHPERTRSERSERGCVEEPVLNKVKGPAFSTMIAIAAILAVSASCAAIAAPKSAPASNAEARTAQALGEAAKTGTAALRGFLYAMPKGADLHMHLTGAIYAESFIRAAGEDGLCVDTTTLAFVKPIAETRSLPPQPVCGEGRVRADSVTKDQHLDDQLIDSFSIRTFVPVAANSGHDHFFDSFAKFGQGNGGYWEDHGYDWYGGI